MNPKDHPELLDELVEFYRVYYADEIAEFVQCYPKDRKTLFVEHGDLFNHNPDFAEDYLNRPDDCQTLLEEALTQYDLPVDVDLSNANVAVTDTRNSIERKGVGELTEKDLGQYVALRCQLGQVSERKPRLKQAAFECQKDGTITEVEQRFSSTQEPVECDFCENQGPFNLDEEQSEWVDQRLVKLQTPPEKKSGAEILGYCLGDMADPDGVNIQDKAGSRVTVLGKLEADYSSLFGGRDDDPVADEYFVPHAFVWGDNLSDEIDENEYRTEVNDVSSRPDAIDVFKRNIDPTLVITDGWDEALEMATVWLFAAPRIDPVEGKTVRGDIHMLFVSDPGMNKSDFAQTLAEISPKALMKDAEGMSSSVSLTAAATREGFGDDSWTIEPGALPKANNGHLILDEIDKGPDGFLNGIHSPLEGEQLLRVEKAGKEATLATRCGFLALGNPVDGRFNPMDDIAEQVDLHPALMSRFDLICTMEDQPDKDVDGEIAGGVLDSIDESARLDHGELDASEATAVTGDVSRDVMKAWVKIARQEVAPMLTEEAKATLKEYYVNVRDANDDNSDTVPATARKLVAGVRISMAYARCELSEKVTERHAERAVELSKSIMGQHNFDPETGDFDANRTTEQPSSQKERVEAITDCLQGDPKEVDEIVEQTGLAKGTVEHRLEKMKERGEVYSPQMGKYQAT